MKVIIWFDFDDTLANWHEVLIPYQNQLFKKDLDYIDYQHHDYFKLYHTDIFDHDWEKLRQFWRDNNIAEQLTPYPCTKEALQVCKNADVKIGIVSARGWHPRGKELIEKMLHNLGIFDAVVVSQKYDKSKGETIQDFSDDYHVIGFIEDTIKHCENVAKIYNPESVYVVRHPWNIHHQHNYHAVDNALEAVNNIILQHQLTPSP